MATSASSSSTPWVGAAGADAAGGDTGGADTSGGGGSSGVPPVKKMPKARLQLQKCRHLCQLCPQQKECVMIQRHWDPHHMCRRCKDDWSAWVRRIKGPTGMGNDNISIGNLSNIVVDHANELRAASDAGLMRAASDAGVFFLLG